MARKTKGYDNNYRGYSALHFIKYLLKKKERRRHLDPEFVMGLYDKQGGSAPSLGSK